MTPEQHNEIERMALLALHNACNLRPARGIEVSSLRELRDREALITTTIHKANGEPFESQIIPCQIRTAHLASRPFKIGKSLEIVLSIDVPMITMLEFHDSDKIVHCSVECITVNSTDPQDASRVVLHVKTREGAPGRLYISLDLTPSPPPIKMPPCSMP